jgi:hypothetical protein
MKNTADPKAALWCALAAFEYPTDFDFDDDDNLIEIKGYLDKALFHHEDVDIAISVEYAHTAGIIGDYWGEFRGNSPWINPKIEELAEEHGYHTEWINPACFGFWD